MIKRTLGTAAIIAALVAPIAANAQEAVISANAGWLSEYYFRGLPQKTSSANLGLDVELGGLYIGTWAGDVEVGTEVDLYGGYVRQMGKAYVGLGGTGYFYTDEAFDDTYMEMNLTAGYGPLGAELSVGQWGNAKGDPLDYWFFAFMAEHAGFSGAIGTFGSGFEGTYVSAGYGFEAAGLDLDVSAIWSDATLLGSESTLRLVFGVSRTFSIR